MSDQDKLFTAEADPLTPAAPAAVPPTTQNPPLDPFVDLLSGITNEDGTQKYSDVASALTSMPHAQTHISNIEKENQALKTDLANAKAAEDLLRKSVNEQTPAQIPFSQEQLASVVNTAIDDKTQAGIKASNLEATSQAFSDAYGDKARSEIQAVADANGVGIDFIKSLAETSPAAVLKLAGLTVKPANALPKSNGNINTGSLDGQPSAHVPKSVMGAASTKDVIASWRAIGEKVRNQST